MPPSNFKPRSAPVERLEDDYRPHFEAYAADPSPRNAGALLRTVDPLVRLGVRTYGGGNSPLAYSRARKIALDALGGYDPRKASLKTHLMSHMRGLQRYRSQLNQPLSVPEQVMLEHQRVYNAGRELEDELGRTPSDAELSDRAGVSMKRLGYVRQYRPAVTEGQFHNLTAGKDEGMESAFDPAVVRRDPALEAAEFVYHDLDPVDQVILERSMGMHGSSRASQKDIAKALGMSPSAVTQRAQRIQMQLDALSDAELF